MAKGVAYGNLPLVSPDGFVDTCRGWRIYCLGPTGTDDDDHRKSPESIIDDEQVRNRLSACAEVLLVGGFENSMMEREGLSPRVVSSLLEEIVRASRRVVETYLAERPIGREMWTLSAPDGGSKQLPDPVDARAWVYRLAGSNQRSR